MAGKKKAEKEDLEKCGECKLDVTRADKAIQCEICELWLHCKCEDMLDETYKVVKQNKIHFFCGRCDKSVGKILKTMVNLTIRQDKLEEDFKVNMAEVKSTIKDFVNTLMEEAKTSNEKTAKLEKSVEDMKKDMMKIKYEQKSELNKLNEEVKYVKKHMKN